MMATEIIASGQITLVDLNDAQSLQSYIGSTAPRVQIYDPVGAGTWTPSWATTPVVLTPELYITGSAANVITNAKIITWYANGTVITSGSGGYTIGASNPKALTISLNVLTDATPNIKYTCEIVYTDTNFNVDVTVKSDFEFSRIKNGATGVTGASAIMAILSNESDSVPSDSAGANQTVTGVAATITVYEGATDVTASWVMGTPAVVGATGTLSGSPTNRTWTLNANGMTADVATVTWTLTRAGYSNIVKVFTISRVRGGVAGTTPTLYRLLLSTNAIQKNVSNVYNPTTLTVSAKSQTGTGVYGNYTGRYMIWESTDGVSFGTVKYTSAADEASKVWTPTAGIKSIKAQLFLAGGTATLLDEQIIPIVVDGATGINSIIAYCWTPGGNVIRNDSGTITAQCDIYNGVTKVTGTAYQWYKQDSTVVADQGGGVGWLKLIVGATGGGTTGYATATLTIPAGAIGSLAIYKCIATYNALPYTDIVTVIDQADPVQLTVIANEGNVFKNGQGTKTIVAKIYQAGVELDAALPNGSGAYEYRWTLRDSAGTVSATFVDSGKAYKTGKTLTVLNTDVTNVGNLVLELWK